LAHNGAEGVLPPHYWRSAVHGARRHHFLVAMPLVTGLMNFGAAATARDVAFRS
jgi:hypothetical protein